MKKVLFAGLLGLLSFSSRAQAAQWCDPMTGVCKFYITPSLLPPIQAQQTMVWCWAAAAQTIFEFYGHYVTQAEIVQTALGTPTPVITTGAPDALLKMLNATYTDSKGQTFTSSTPSFIDNYPYAPGNVINYAWPHKLLTQADIENDLTNERPLFYADQTHAMAFVEMIEQWHIQKSGWVLDPAPSIPIGFGPITAPGIPAIGLRELTPPELQTAFMARVEVH